MCSIHDAPKTYIGIYTPMAFACNEGYYKENCSKYFPMNAIGHAIEKLTDFLGVICRFNKNIRIEVHFFVCIGK